MARRPARISVLAVALVALAGVDAAAQTDRDDVRQSLRYILTLEGSGRLDLARAELIALLRDHPADLGAVLAWERVSRRLGALEDALPVLARAIRIDSTAALLRQTELRVLADLGRIDEVVAAGERWLRVAPRSANAYREYAVSLRRVGQPGKAEAVLLEGQRRAERPEMLTIALADLYTSEGRWDAAARQWVIVLDGSPAMGWDLVASRLGSLGRDAPTAAAEILEAIGDEPATLGAARLGAVAALYAGRRDEARRMAEAALRGMDAGARRRFIDDFAAAAMGRDQPALVAWAYRRLLREVPDDSTSWELARQIVRYDLSAGDSAAAALTLEDVLARAEPTTPAHQWAAGLRLRLLAAIGLAEQAGRALDDYTRLYPRDPDLPDLALIVAWAHLRSGRLDEARGALDIVAGRGTSRGVRARTAALRAYLDLHAGNFESARAGFDSAAATLTGAGRGEAIRMLRLLREASDAELRAVAAAHVAMLQSDPGSAFQRLMDGLERTPPSSGRPALLVWAGELAIEAESLEQAEGVLRGVVATYPESPQAPLALMTLAESLASAGRRDDAIALLETLIIEYPESALTPIGRRRLAELREEVPRS